MSIDAPSVSYSWHSQYRWCPRQFRYQRIEKLPPDRPDTVYSVFGKSIHALLSRMYKEQLFSLNFLLSNWPTDFDAELVKSGFRFKTEKRKLTWVRKGEEILTKFYNYAENYHLLVPAIETEWRFRLRITTESGRTFYLVGVIDLIIRVDGKIWIIDFKTGTFHEKGAKDQLTLYSLAFRLLRGESEDYVALFYLRDGELLESTRTATDHKEILNQIEEDFANIDQKKFEPTYEKCHLCLYRGRCASEDLEKGFGVEPAWFGYTGD